MHDYITYHLLTQCASSIINPFNLSLYTSPPSTFLHFLLQRITSGLKKTSWYLPSTTLMLSCALQPPDTHTLETPLVVHVDTYNYDTHAT